MKRTLKRPLTSAVAVTVALSALTPGTALAHGFGERYDLPVPLGLYLTAAAAAVVLSFVAIGLFARSGMGATYPRKNLLEWRVGRAIASPWALGVFKALSTFAFVVYLVAGLFGTNDPTANIVPTMTWVIFWVGIAYVSALVGNVWALISPWTILFSYAETAYTRITGGDFARYEPYPTALAGWPALGLFFVFAWVEIVYVDSSVPFNIATLVLAYSFVTFVGMWWFGRDVWLRNGEVFAIALGFFAAFAPTEVHTDDDGETTVNDYQAYGDAAPVNRGFNVRPWGVGLLATPPLDISHAVLLVVMLATVSFDGFVETGTWTRVLRSPLFDFFGARAFTGITTLGLLAAPLLALGIFALTAWLMGLVVDSKLGVIAIMRTFAYSLVPIAIAYHIAHFFSFLAIQGQRVFSLASDPLGLGWDLFGTADVGVDIGIVNARFVWFLSIGAIVLGHIAAVTIAHGFALRVFPGKRQAVLSQYPMLVLMAGYTMASLWIVAQPIVAH